MIMMPVTPAARAFAIDWFLEDLAHGRMTDVEAREMLAQLRLAGDLANLERVAQVVAAHRAR